MHLFECISCGYGTNVQARADRHREANGPLHNNECTQCCQKFQSHAEYRSHVEKEHKRKWTYRCGFCSEVFDKKTKRGIDSYINGRLICDFLQ